MKNAATLVVLLLVITVACADAKAPRRIGRSCDHSNMSAGCDYTKQPDWDYLIFVQTWPGAFCSDGCCVLPDGLTTLDGFTIHGFWPNYDDGSYPACCTSSYTDNELFSLIDSDPVLKDNLRRYWPSLKKCNFVEYEFDKHGTCASTLYSGSNGPVDYWNAALNLRMNGDLYAALQMANVTPSTSSKKVLYDPTKVIIPALMTVTGDATPILVCESSDRSELMEVRLCVTRDETNKESPLLMSECPSNLVKQESNCLSSGVWLRSWPNPFNLNGCPM